MKRGPLSGGPLFVVATPIGNLGDLAPRAREVLASVTLIASESITATRRLLSALKIRCPRLLSYREENRQSAEVAILEHLRSGQPAALVCEAGTPAISDPGWELVHACQSEGIPVQAVAGPCAVVAALSVAGLACKVFKFLGFPPNQRKARREFLASQLGSPETTVLFESPHRLKDCLADLQSLLGGAQELVVVRELTKIYEQARRATLDEHLEHFEQESPRGEFVLIVPERPVSPLPQNPAELQRKVELLRSGGLSSRDIVEFLSKIEGYPRNQVYGLLTLSDGH